MAKGYVEAKFETAPGNEAISATLSTKELFFPVITANSTLGADPLDRDDELRNADEPLSVIAESYDPTWELDLRAYPDSVGFLLKALLGAPTTSTGNGTITDPDSATIPTGAYKHVWTSPFGPTGATPQTMQLFYSYVDQGVYFVHRGAATQQLDISSPQKGGVQLKATGPSLYYNTVSDPSKSPAYESLAIPPFLRPNVTLTSGLSGSAVGAKQVEDASFSIANPVAPLHTFGGGSKWPDLMEKGDGPVILTGALQLRDLTQADWNALRDSTGFTLAARYTSTAIIASSYPYKFYVSLSNCQYVSGDADALDNKRNHGSNMNFKATNAGSASVTLTLVNSTASYA